MAVHERDRHAENVQIAAAVYAAGLGFETYVPMRPHIRLIAGKRTKCNVPRYGPYLFVQFDRDDPNWGELERGPKYFDCILRDRNIPVPVPERAMAAMRAFAPEPEI